MTTSPVEAEATGQQYLVVSYKKHDYKLLVDVDHWPLDLITVSVGISDKNKLIADRGVVAQALRMILGDQWDGFVEAFPRSRDLVAASQTFAAAVGFAAESEDRAFGALPRLLATLAIWRDAVEATLGEMGLVYGDRWRFDAEGRRTLTLRQIHVRLKYARYDSALAVAQNDGKVPFTANDLVLMDLFEQVARQPHPARPISPAQAAERQPSSKTDKAVEDYRKRHAKSPRQAAIETAQSNARPTRKAAHAQYQSEEAEARSSG